jgi:heptosyltransferase-2
MIAKPKSILVRAPNWIGDQVLAFPFYHYLRKAYPQARIAVSCVPWVEALQFRNLVDEVFVLPRSHGDRWLDKVAALNEGAAQLAARGPWDLAVSLPNSLSSAWLLYRANAIRRRGYSVEGRGLLLNERLPWDPNAERHRAQAYMDLLPEEVRPSLDVRAFWGVPAENELDPSTPGELDCFDPVSSWPDAEPLSPPAEPYWVLAPGATAVSRRWPLDYVVGLARLIAKERGFTGVVVGGPAEAPVAMQLTEDKTLRLIDMAAQGPVTGLWKLFRNAKFTVTNESGLAHVAALCGSPVQIVCGAADPRRTCPIGPGKVRVAINPVECWPCERNSCSEPFVQSIRCLRGIKPDVVWEEIKSAFRF